jgi:hypothetical protein
MVALPAALVRFMLPKADLFGQIPDTLESAWAHDEINGLEWLYR